MERIVTKWKFPADSKKEETPTNALSQQGMSLPEILASRVMQAAEFDDDCILEIRSTTEWRVEERTAVFLQKLPNKSPGDSPKPVSVFPDTPPTPNPLKETPMPSTPTVIPSQAESRKEESPKLPILRICLMLLLTLPIVALAIALQAIYCPGLALPFVMLATIIAYIVVGVFLLRVLGVLSEKAFQRIISWTYKILPLLKQADSKDRPTNADKSPSTALTKVDRANSGSE
jgi:hypothetical protein